MKALATSLVSRIGRVTTLAGIALSSACANDGGSSPSVDDPLSNAQKAQLDAYLGAAIERFSIPGAAVAVVRGRDVLYQQTFGIRGVGHPQPVTPNTRFMTASVTKSMTTLMAATLVDDGKLGWDERVVDVWPAFQVSDPESTPELRLRHLFSHSSGLDRRDTSLFFEVQPPTAMMASVRGIPIIAAPGEHYQYHNQGFATAGYLAAIASGVAFEDAALVQGWKRLVQERVFSPIGMSRTTLELDSALADPDHAWPHSYDGMKRAIGEVPVALEGFGSTTAPASSAWSNVSDMAAYASTQLSGVAPNGKRIASLENVRETQRGVIAEGNGPRYAMGWHEEDGYMGMRAVHHDGDGLGFTSQVFLLPEADLGVVVLANRVAAQAFYQAVQRFAVETALGLEHASDATEFATNEALFGMLEDLGAATSIVSREDADPYLGQYGDQVRVAFNENGFVLNNGRADMPLVSLGAPGAFATGGIINGRFSATFDTTKSPPQLALDMLISEEGLPQPYVLERSAD